MLSIRPLKFTAFTIVAIFTTYSDAAVVVWTGGGPATSWSNSVNWGGGPLPDDVARFTDSGLAAGAHIDLDITPTLNQLHFSGTTLPFAVAGGTVSLNGSGTGKLGLLRNGSATDVQTLASAITLNENLEFNIAGSGGSLAISGIIGEAGGSRGFAKTGSRPLELTGDNTFTGVVSLLQNNTIVGHNNALGLGTSPIRVARTTGTNQAFLLTKTGVNLSRDLVVRSGSTGAVRIGGQDGQTSSDFSGAIHLERDVDITGGNTGSATVRFNGPLVDATAAVEGVNAFVSSNVTKVGNGRVKLLANNTYSGTTTVTAGSLFINGSLSPSNAAVTVADRLGGAGTIHRPVSVLATGTLIPGDVGIGTLTIVSDKPLSLADGATINFELGATPANADKVAAAIVEFAANLNVRLTQRTGTASPGATFSLLTWTGPDPASLPAITLDAASDYTGAFSFAGAADGLPGGSLTVTDLTPISVPEPGVLGLTAVAAVLLTRRRRLR